MKILKNLIVIAFISSLVIACGNENKENNTDSKTLSGSVKIDGSSTVYPITEAIAEEYRNEQADIKVTIGISGTGGGFKKFIRKETDISDASRPIKEKEINGCKENSIEYIELEVAYDGLAVLVNPENDWVDYFTVEELKKLWEPSAQETITKWSQIRKGWPDEDIHLFGPGTASGTYDYFTEVIVGKSGSSRGDFTASEDDNVLVQGIAGDKFGLGFFGLAYYQENKDKLKLIAVDNGNGAVKPGLTTVKDGSYAPLSRPLFIYVSKEALKRPEVAGFTKFYMETVGSLVSEVGYIPLTDEEYAKQLEKLN